MNCHIDNTVAINIIGTKKDLFPFIKFLIIIIDNTVVITEKNGVSRNK